MNLQVVIFVALLNSEAIEAWNRRIGEEGKHETL